MFDFLRRIQIENGNMRDRGSDTRTNNFKWGVITVVQQCSEKKRWILQNEKIVDAQVPYTDPWRRPRSQKVPTSSTQEPLVRKMYLGDLPARIITHQQNTFFVYGQRSMQFGKQIKCCILRWFLGHARGNAHTLILVDGLKYRDVTGKTCAFSDSWVCLHEQ